jgi:hypothetical protein
VIAKPLAGGKVAFYFNVPTRYRALGCSIPNEPLGADYAVACGPDGKGGRAVTLNALFDEWMNGKSGEPLPNVVRHGTVDWLFREYKQTKAYLERYRNGSRPDYERTMLLVTDMITKKGDRIGDRKIKAITQVSADKIYELIVNGPRGLRPRQGEKLVGLCASAWSVVHRLYPDAFNSDVLNPWRGVTKNRRTKAIKPAVTRDDVYAFANTAIAAGYSEAGCRSDLVWSKNPSDCLFMRLLDDNNAGARPIARSIGRTALDRGPGSEEIAGRCPFLGGCAPHGSGQRIHSGPAVANARQRG